MKKKAITNTARWL